jgi:elongation factor Tu
MPRLAHIRARVTYLKTEEGGRHTPVYSGYRGQFHYEGEHDTAWDAVQYFVGRGSVQPGDSAECKIQFVSPSNHLHRVRPGLRFHIQEGGRVMANGVVTEVLP